MQRGMMTDGTKKSASRSTYRGYVQSLYRDLAQDSRYAHLSAARLRLDHILRECKSFPSPEREQLFISRAMELSRLYHFH